MLTPNVSLVYIIACGYPETTYPLPLPLPSPTLAQKTPGMQYKMMVFIKEFYFGCSDLMLLELFT